MPRSYKAASLCQIQSNLYLSSICLQLRWRSYIYLCVHIFIMGDGFIAYRLSWARAIFQKKSFACAWQCHNPCCATYTRFSSGWGGWGHAVVRSEPWSKPIKHIWDTMELFMRYMDNSPTIMGRLREVLLQAWGALTPERMEALVRRMPGPLRALMAARGSHTQD